MSHSRRRRPPRRQGFRERYHGLRVKLVLAVLIVVAITAGKVAYDERRGVDWGGDVSLQQLAARLLSWRRSAHSYPTAPPSN